MKIGVMLRTMDEKQGIGIYTQNLMDHLLRLDQKNEYVLFYRNPVFLGRYAGYDNVREKVVSAPNKIIWDQVKIPWEARQEKVDLIFHTKFTVPFFTRRKTVMAIHGAGWFVHPELYGKLDTRYIKLFLSFYCKKAAGIISNSDLTTQDFIRIVGVNPEKVRTAHLAAADCFQPIEDQDVLARTRRKYCLPERFILSVIKYDPRKNFENLIRAFQICHERVDCKLVVVGSGCEKYREEHRLDDLGLSRDVHFLGWVEQEELPAIYSLAEFLFFPSVYEEFGIPVCEALACGTPMVVSRTGALSEIAGAAGILVDPFNPLEMADVLYRMWTEHDLREDKRGKALLRSREFSWEKCARETLEVFERVGNGQEISSAA
jgi:glycosyltransferase involved in cell wall biosynthesis